MSRAAPWLLFGPAAGWLLVSAAGLGAAHLDDSAWGSVERDRAAIAGSADCKRCHPTQHRAWHASYHRTMTQRARGEAVLAPFEGETLVVLGYVATMDRDDAGGPRITVRPSDPPDAAPVFSANVELTVGSHRYQQYVARIDRGGGPLERWRLPVAWHLAEERWIHLGGAFLFPDVAPGDWDGWTRHLTRWNDNCLFCHNTAVNPGLGADGMFATTFAELGIGCEACHGPAKEHVARQSDPFHRMAATVRGPKGDRAVTHPGRIGAATSSEICGRCHGNRIGHDLEAFLVHGDRYVPGEPLARWSRPIFADATLETAQGSSTPFRNRFWPDGTPRLSAYEYQALLLSPCYDDGEGIGCLDCHAMHGDDPDMQLRADFDRTATCVACHAVAELSGAAGHGGHATVDCTGCHMPRVTYGLLEGMMSHRVTTPEPAALLGRFDAPDACTQCHVDRDRNWACASMRAIGFPELACAAAFPIPPTGASQVEIDLVGGDPVQRALAAHALSSAAAVGRARRRAQALVDALEDGYPAVRWFAQRGLEDLLGREPTLAPAAQALEGFEFMGDPATRLPAVDRLRQLLGTSRLGADPVQFEALVLRRDGQLIEIGE